MNILVGGWIKRVPFNERLKNSPVEKKKKKNSPMV